MRLSAANLSKINPHKRIQTYWYFNNCFPTREDKKCACGCEIELTGRKTRWASKECSDLAYDFYAVRYGHSSHIRSAVFQRDQGACRTCGLVCKESEWQADHIVEVHQGGGGCGLDNFQTLCVDCHKDKTKQRFKIAA